MRSKTRNRSASKRATFDKEFFDCYSTAEKPNLYIDAESIGNGLYFVNMTNAIVLFIFERYAVGNWFHLNVVSSKGTESSTNKEVVLKYQSRNLMIPTKFITPECISSLPVGVNSCQRPSISVESRKLHISGLTSVVRFLLKFSSIQVECQNVHEMRSLLGFRGGCLAACAEASVWTTFCEVEMTQRMVTSLVTSLETRYSTGELEIPEDLVRFENHLAQPVRTHNFRKKIQDQLTIQGEKLQKQRPLEQIEQLHHVFAEGPDLTLSDLILFPCVLTTIHVIGEDTFKTYLPKVTTWLKHLENEFKNTPLQLTLFETTERVASIESLRISDLVIKIPKVPLESLYKSDPPRDKSRMNDYTKQTNVDEAVEFLKEKKIELFEVKSDYIDGILKFLEWENVPSIAHPEGGQLPESRRERKCEQLGNLVEMVKFISNERHSDRSKEEKGEESCLTIVDFCSGGGHLGILVAWLIPDAQVILVENKEESLRRAEIRVDQMGLPNVTFFQCNLNSFLGKFDIGLALHACGTATDLVLKKCEESAAAFVVSPCCYGAIRTNHVVQYPRSFRFRDTGLSLHQYFVLAHSADQTHDEKNPKTAQGQTSMQIVDTDRLAYFYERKYKVWLRKMTSEIASPKNHILVGIPN